MRDAERLREREGGREREREEERERGKEKCWKRIVHQIDDMKMKITNNKFENNNASTKYRAI